MDNAMQDLLSDQKNLSVILVVLIASFVSLYVLGRLTTPTDLGDVCSALPS